MESKVMALINNLFHSDPINKLLFVNIFSHLVKNDQAIEEPVDLKIEEKQKSVGVC